MGRAVVPLVIVLAAGCLPAPPRELQIESRFSDEETELLLDAIDATNQELGDALLGGPVVTYQGRYHDPDGFTFEDFDDDRHVMYVFDPDSDAYRWLVQVSDHGFFGYGTLADTLVVPLPSFGNNHLLFRITAMHELGHFLGMVHSTDPATLMFPGDRDASVMGFTAADQRAFCLTYDCATPPP
jgi:hypothetical protein